MPRLTAPQAASYLGITEEDLLRAYYRGLPPGNLGWKEGSTVMWNSEDLLPFPESRLKPEPDDGVVHTSGDDSEEHLVSLCPTCLFQAKSAAGLKTHRRAKGH